ncbi:MAG TPA: DUF1587 domain-containing protein, partial [Planctomycetia bacterium]|nr:DUF1587 domain-containing protein [Planctomycetia bacterium]
MPDPASRANSSALRPLLLAAMLVAPAAPAADVFATLQAEYAASVRPLTTRFCLECHSAAKKEGELDLERFASLADVRRDPKAWVKVGEMLHDGEMPPKTSKQPTTAEKRSLGDWARRYLDAEARAAAGDPGPVVLRRLSNAEYRYTLEDLAGVDLNPGKEFPADGAAGEGFTNAGGAQTMSPALLAKYFDAGKEVARHAVLLPDGIRFSPASTRADWTNEALDRIRGFYRRFAASGGGAKVNLQGVIFDTNDGGLLPVENYVAALLAERAAIAAGSKSVEAVARDRKLNAKYLGILWRTLEDRSPSLALDAVRAKWRAAKPNEPG